MNTQVFLLQCRAAGIDVETALARFGGNTELFIKYLCQFPQHWDYPSLCHSIKTGDEPTFHHAMHNLKSETGNLGLTKAFYQVQDILNLLHKESLSNPEQAMKLLDALHLTCTNICKVLNSFQEGREIS